MSPYPSLYRIMLTAPTLTSQLNLSLFCTKSALSDKPCGSTPSYQHRHATQGAAPDDLITLFLLDSPLEHYRL